MHAGSELLHCAAASASWRCFALLLAGLHPSLSPCPPRVPLLLQGTGKWTIQQAAELSVAAPTMEAALDARFLSGLKDERVAAEAFYAEQGVAAPGGAARAGWLGGWVV